MNREAPSNYPAALAGRLGRDHRPILAMRGPIALLLGIFDLLGNSSYRDRPERALHRAQRLS